jgi:hypothetical protein
MGTTTGVSSIITSVSRKALTFGNQFVESRTTVAKVLVSSPRFEGPVVGGAVGEPRLGS